MLNEARRAEARRQARERFERSEASGEPPDKPRDAFGAEAQARADWQRSQAIRAEFGELERYIAFVKADAKGLVKIFGRK